jgi:hypothetical protein
MSTIKYSADGLNFSLIGSAGGVILPEMPVPETGVAYVSTRLGPRVVTFPHYDLEDKGRVKVNTVFSLTPETTAVVGKCADADAISDSYDDDDENDLDLDEDELDDDELDDDDDDPDDEN